MNALQGVGVAETTPFDCPFGVGQKIRMRAELGPEVHMVVFRHGKHVQVPFEDQAILRALKGGEVVTSVEVLTCAIPNKGSASAEDCWFRVGFTRIGEFENWLRFSAWQFEVAPSDG